MSEKAKAKRKPINFWKWLFIGVFGLLFLSFFAFLWLSAQAIDAWGTNEEFSGQVAQNHIEEILGSPLPENSSDAYLHYMGFRDYFLRMRFSAPDTEIETWLANAKFCIGEFNTEQGSENYFRADSQELPWWTPNAATSYRIFEQCGTNPYYELFIDTSDAKTWIVYLVVFST